MNRIKEQLGPFLGLNTAVDDRYIDRAYARAIRNVRIVDGSIDPRYGYRNLQTAHANQGAVYGLEYLQGYNASNVEVEEYGSVQNITAQSRPFSFNVSNGTRTEITNNGSALDLADSEWRMFAWRNTSYWTNPADAGIAYRHELGNATNFQAIVGPNGPTSALTYSFNYGGGANAYKTVSWAGMNAANSTQLACTGLATNTNSSVVGTDIMVAHVAGANVVSSFEILMNATTAGGTNSFDFYRADVFGIELSSGYGENNTLAGQGMYITPLGLQIQFSDNNGTAYIPQNVSYSFDGDNGEGTRFSKLSIRWEYLTKTRSAWGNDSATNSTINTGLAGGKILKLKVTYTVGQTSTHVGYTINFLRVTPLAIGGVMPLDRSLEQFMNFGYAYYNSTSTEESAITGELSIPRAAACGYSYFAGLEPFGAWLDITATASSQTDQWKLFVKAYNQTSRQSTWRLVSTQNDSPASSLTYLYRLAFWERNALAEYSSPGGFSITGLKFGVPFRGWVVWFYQGGYQNVKHSKVGLPEKLADSNPDPTDILRGATFTLADNFGDEAVNAFAIDNVLVIAGGNGFYAQQGDYPSTMSPPRKIPDSRGVANAYACAKFRDDQGLQGVAYVDRSGSGIWFAYVNDATDDRSMRVVRLDTEVDGRVDTFLRSEQSLTNFSTCRVWFDARQDSLWVAMGSRAMVWRRPSPVDGKRQWEEYTYTMANSGTIAYASGTDKRGVRWLRSTGQFDENEWDTANRAYIEGATRDGGSAMPAMYWESMRMTGDNTRLDRVYVERDTYTNTPAITATSSRQATTKTMTSGKRYTRFGFLQQGWEHRIKLAPSEGDDPIRRVTMEFVGPIGRRGNA